MRNAATRSPLRHGACRHRRGARGAALSLCALLLAVAAMVPVNVNVSFSPCKLGVDVNRSQSYAVAPAVAGASAAIEEMAAAAGLTSSEFVVTACNAIAVYAGVCVVNDMGIEASYDLATNLDHLLDAADYPAWDTLSSESQELWESKENYDAAKFNSLMAAFGYKDYLDGYYASGGGNFEMDEDVRERLEQFGRIGNLWLGGAGNFFSDVAALFTDLSIITDSFKNPTVTFDGTDVDGWPSNVPVNVTLGYGNKFYSFYYTNSNKTQVSGTMQVIGNDVYAWYYRTNSTNLFKCYFSKDPFLYVSKNSYTPDDWPTELNGSATLISTSYGDIYNYTTNVYFNTQYGYGSSVPLQWIGTNLSKSERDNAMAIMLYGVKEGDIPYVEGFPGTNDVPDDQETYLPEDGVTPVNQWVNYITQPENPHKPAEPVPRPENPFNPSDPDNPSYQSGTPEWNQETSQNLAPAMDIQFNKLFPFCMIYDLQLFWDRLKSIAGVDSNGLLRTQARSQYELIQLPSVDSAGLEEGMTLDLEPLATLLRYTRPAVFWLLIVGVIMSVIEFWKRILTGA